MPKILGAIVTILSLYFSASVSSHSVGEGYVYFDVSDNLLAGRLELTLSDIDKAVPLRVADEKGLSEQGFNLNKSKVLDYIRQNLAFLVDGRRYEPVFTDHDFVHLEWGSFVRMDFELPEIGQPPPAITVQYSLFFNGPIPNHRGQVLIERNSRAGIDANESQFSAIFGPGREVQSVELDTIPWLNVFRNFVRHGVWHIWIGFDHVLFLVALLLPSVMVYRSRQWAPAETFRESFIYVVKVVTLFTVAHTITLSLAALGIVQLPAPLVEGVIALSIAIVALNILRPFLDNKVWIVVFVFGLFHGLGFASVLEPLGVSGASKSAALVGFNVGVEIGQLAIIIVVFPLLFVLRGWKGYKPLALQLGSVALMLIAIFWFVERTIDVPFISADTFKITGLTVDNPLATVNLDVTSSAPLPMA